uniref:Ubiquitin-like domain-containing protein n=1 Tax=Peronospora matthiolae TaxID=2874970 RepID=A0AAV1UQV0_9STRA
MQLFVRSDAGRVLTVAVATSQTKVQELLLSLVEIKDLNSCCGGYLNYGGVPLQASRCLADYGIQDHATLDFARRLRGGCFSVSILLWTLIFICCLISVCTCGLSLPVALFLLPPALLLPLCCL